MDASLRVAFGVGLVLLGAWLLRHRRATEERVRGAQYWPSVEGEVIESEVQSHDAQRRIWSTRLRYRYTVNGEPHLGKAIVIGGELRGGRARAEARATRYPVGARPAVFYDPMKPAIACLERVHEGAWLELIGAVGAFGVGTALILGLGA